MGSPRLRTGSSKTCAPLAARTRTVSPGASWIKHWRPATAATVLRAELGPHRGSIADRQGDLGNALDLLYLGI